MSNAFFDTIAAELQEAFHRLLELWPQLIAGVRYGCPF